MWITQTHRTARYKFGYSRRAGPEPVPTRRRSRVFLMGVGTSGIAANFNRLLHASTGFGHFSLACCAAVAGLTQHCAKTGTGWSKCHAGLATSLQKLSTRDHKILQVGSSITQLLTERNGPIVRHRNFVRKATFSVMSTLGRSHHQGQYFDA
jgi:hypothetical protein